MAHFETEQSAVSKELIKAILNKEFKPGEKLVQRKVAERFNTTQITIREAFRSIESSGLIEIEPKWGVYVTELNLDTIKEKYIVREALEVMAARILSQNIQESDRIALLEKADKIDSVLHANDHKIEEKAELHFQFHLDMVAAAKCNELTKLMGNLNFYMLFVSNTYHLSWQEDYPQAHRRLVENITNNPPDIAEKYVRKAILRGFEKDMEFLSKVK